VINREDAGDAKNYMRNIGSRGRITESAEVLDIVLIHDAFAAFSYQENAADLLQGAASFFGSLKLHLKLFFAPFAS
jgi:hypothetical protein